MTKKIYSLAVLIMAFLSSSAQDSSSNSSTMEVSNKDKVVALLKSIETGDKAPAGYINPNKYIQHNQSVADGLAGFGAVLQQLPEGSAKANTVRVIEDGDFVIAHTDYNFFGPKIGIDIFRFEDGLIVEHWDNLQEKVTETASGRSQIDGTAEVKDLDKTKSNKKIVKHFIDDVLFGKHPEKITDYVSTEEYLQHNPNVKDGLAGLGEALEALNKAGMPMVYKENHALFGEGNFVVAVSEGIFMKKEVAFYDIFRLDDGKIVEHWDAIQEILPESEAKNSNGKFNF
ncbi:nuclear transport factor 2 family protein [Flammeovirga aprica]|uniref:SnoaL-like domain-containing protein n=1 Tax=Flammeovirga aprica JL-4 TaxID=694437 RepID=A0A7X9XD68_9BACT|nr:nuclear transport factor 2 family protein [Flammeovirga aprica]NME72552.1 SnoaL-like domain-containing protein [Flammeovirga aprica JL-4]